SSRRRHTRFSRDWSSDVCSSDLALADLQTIRQRARTVVVQDKGKQFNTDLMDAVEIGFMVDYAEAIAAGARRRTESRGAHSRERSEERRVGEASRNRASRCPERT